MAMAFKPMSPMSWLRLVSYLETEGTDYRTFKIPSLSKTI